jgi:hypothetical protein
VLVFFPLENTFLFFVRRNGKWVAQIYFCHSIIFSCVVFSVLFFRYLSSGHCKNEKFVEKIPYMKFVSTILNKNMKFERKKERKKKKKKTPLK